MAESAIVELEAQLAQLPAGYISRKMIHGKERFYQQWTENGKLKSKYIRNEDVEAFREQIARRKRLQAELSEKIEKLRTFISPEQRIIKTSMERGNKLFEKNDFKNSNKYFSKVMLFSREDSSEYKLAKSKITNA